MGIVRIGHLYLETGHRDESIEFWERPGISVAERWGSDGHRAGRLECRDATVVLAEMSDTPASSSVVFDVEDPAAAAGLPGVKAPRGDTHWGTKWMQVSDPDGRVYSLEERI